MPGLTLADLEASTRIATLAQLRQALGMIISDPYARALLLTTPSAPDAPGDTTALADWLYAHWWCGPGLQADRVDPADPASRLEAARGAARLEAGRRLTAPRSGGWLVLAAVAEVLVAARLQDGRADAPGSSDPGWTAPGSSDPGWTAPGSSDPGWTAPGWTAPGSSRRITTSPDAVVASSRPGLPPRPGDLVTVRHGRSGLDPAHAWWWAHSSQPEELADRPLDRWYVHARDLAAATRLVPLLLAVATEVDCPVTLKCPPTETGYGRRDALVVYLPRERSGEAERALRRQAPVIESLVGPDVPPLTRQLLSGVARAEDPGQGGEEEPVSYGQLRCRQVATVATDLIGARIGPDLTRLDDPTLIAASAAVGLDVDAVERMA